MTAQGSNIDDRQVIPRWRSFKGTVEMQELQALAHAKRESAENEIAILRSSFEENGTVFHAADLFNALIADGQSGPEVKALANRIIGLDDSPTGLKELAVWSERPSPALDTDFIFETSLAHARRHARESRQHLNREPRNAIRWVDLALAHVTLGENTKGVREIQTALALAPNNRFVLRAATRLFVHLKEPDRANWVLAQSNRLEHDPWLLAADLSTSQLAFGRFRNERAAREILVSANFSPMSISELASELGTSEARSGKGKRARLLFDVALQDPTENAVAQATVVASAGDLQIDPSVLEIRRGFEARAINLSRGGEFEAAAQEGRRWHLDQPFALEPALFTSYAASVGAFNFELALEATEVGLRAHPENALLLNNAAFALANLGRTTEAQIRLDAASPERKDAIGSAVHLATQGLIHYREGHAQLGREEYTLAIRDLQEASRHDVAAIAAGFLALEESRVGSPLSSAIRELAQKSIEANPSPEGLGILKRLSGEPPIDLSRFPV